MRLADGLPAAETRDATELVEAVRVLSHPLRSVLSVRGHISVSQPEIETPGRHDRQSSLRKLIVEPFNRVGLHAARQLRPDNETAETRTTQPLLGRSIDSLGRAHLASLAFLAFHISGRRPAFPLDHLLPYTYGNAVGAGNITNSFKTLRTLADLFQAPAVRSDQEKQAIRLAKRLGATAVPLLLRKLLGPEHEASLAYLLFSYIRAERATAALRRVALDASLPDDKRALAIALLGERDALPAGIRLADEDGMRRRAAIALSGRLETPADVARAADLLLEQIAPEDLPALMEALAESSGARISPLVDELLLRDEPTRAVKSALRELRRRVGDAVVPPIPVSAPARIRIGRAGDGSRLVLAALPGREGSERLLTVTVSTKGLGAACYESQARPGAWRRALAQAESAGYELRDATVGAAAAIVAEAARRTRRAGAQLPRGYYLGRDLLGLSDEHAAVDATGNTRSLHVKPVSLSRGTALLAKGDVAGAKRAFTAYVAARPEDAEGRSCLGLCLLQLGEEDESLRELQRAARLDPEEPLRHWNLAAAARQTGKPGTCYLALLDYLRCGERGRGTAARRRSAREFLDMFSRFAATEHPGITPESLARGEEIFDRAYRHLVAGRFDDAITGFEAVVKLVPSHYASWGNLGAAYARENRLAEAERCLRRALEVRPDYEPAQRNLLAITAEL